MASQRSNTSTRLRIQVAEIFVHHFPDMIEHSSYLGNQERRARWKALIGYKEGPNGTLGQYSAMNAPCLNKNGVDRFSVTTFLHHELLLQIYVALLRGPTAAKSLAFPDIIKVGHNEVMADILGLTHTTPGAVAGVAVLVRALICHSKSLGTNKYSE